MSCFRVCVLFALIVTLALTPTAHAQPALADRIQSGDRRAALELIAKGADVNQTQADGTVWIFSPT